MSRQLLCVILMKFHTIANIIKHIVAVLIKYVLIHDYILTGLFIIVIKI